MSAPKPSANLPMPRKKKLANHVLLQHGNTTYAQKAQEDIQRIKLEKQEKKKKIKKTTRTTGRKKKRKQDTRRK